MDCTPVFVSASSRHYSCTRCSFSHVGWIALKLQCRICKSIANIDDLNLSNIISHSTTFRARKCGTPASSPDRNQVRVHRESIIFHTLDPVHVHGKTTAFTLHRGIRVILQ